MSDETPTTFAADEVRDLIEAAREALSGGLGTRDLTERATIVSANLALLARKLGGGEPLVDGLRWFAANIREQVAEASRDRF